MAPQQLLRGRYGDYAGFASRAVAFVVDLIIIAAILAGIAFAGQLTLDMLGFGEWGNFTERLFRLTMVVLTLLLPSIYMIVLWMLAGKTLGMALMGLQVVGTDGGRIHIGMAIRRAIGLYLSMILFLGYLWVLIDPKRQGFHDKLAGTLVVYAWIVPKEEEPRPILGNRLRALRRQYRISLRDEGRPQ